MVIEINPIPQEAHETLTKTRTAIITLVAACSFAGAAIVPAVSQASSKQAPKQTHEQLCESYEAEFNAHEETAEDPANSAGTKARCSQPDVTLRPGANCRRKPR